MQGGGHLKTEEPIGIAEKAMAQARESSPFLLRRRSQFTPAANLVEGGIRDSTRHTLVAALKEMVLLSKFGFT